MTIPEMKIPDRFEQAKTMPDDPPYSKAYCYGTSASGCLALVYPFPAEQAMPYADPRPVIDGIHRDLAEDQGLIEVETGVTAAGRRYIYSIVKTLKKPHGVQYFLRLNMEYPECAMQVHAFFDEMGTSGFRDAMVYSMLDRQGAVTVTENGLEGWCRDPYDPAYGRGVLMNCSERRQYDEMFPEHPLSEMRRFVRELGELN